MSYQYTQSYVALGSGSTTTSNAFYIGDFARLTMSILTSGTTSSATFIIQVSNADGFQRGDLGGPSQTTGWSNLTIILPASMYLAGNVGTANFVLDPMGWRWIRSATSPDALISHGTLTFVGSTF